MGDTAGSSSVKNKVQNNMEAEAEDSDDEVLDSEDDDETIVRIQRAHFAQAAAMNSRRRSAPKKRPMSQKRKMEAVKSFHDFTKKLKKDTGITIRSLVGNNILELSDFTSEDSKSESDGITEEEFVVNPNAVQELEENESYLDPETGDIVQPKRRQISEAPVNTSDTPESAISEVKTDVEPKTLSISDIINDGELDNKNVEIAEVEGSELCSEKTAEEFLDIKHEEDSQDFDITEKLKEMGEISVKPINKQEDEGAETTDGEKTTEGDDEKKSSNPNALNVRRNIREVMDEKNLDASTLAAQRQESERLARVQEQQRIIREVQRQIALNRQKIQHKSLSLMQGGSSILKKSLPGHKLNLPNTVLVKLPSGEMKKTTMRSGQLEVTKLSKATMSGAHKIGKLDQKAEKKEVVEIVDSSSGEESSSSSSDSDDCIMLSDSEVPPSPEAEEDPSNSGLHVNDTYNIPDEQGRVLINLGHPENEEDIFLAPQIARIIKPHQIGGVRFLFDNIIESVERFSTSTGFGCILAHSMGLGKTLQIVCFCDIFLRHTSSKTVLCIMPINTLQNWVAEFNMWLPLDASTSPLSAHGEVRPRHFPIYVLNDSHKTLTMRAKVVKDWTTNGGVLMIGYELYRLLSMKKDKKPRKKRKADAKAEAEKEEKKPADKDPPADDTQVSEESKLDKEDADPSKIDENKDDGRKEEKKEDVNDEDKKLLDDMYEALVKPGPDLVICDEGHRIKNSHSNISYALKQMRTKRRIVLTGYPLQNNLLEYWCMVDFVRPNYLGSKTEFCNMFERPIQNGQCIDSTPQDIRLMRYRAHVLHSLLLGFVQRRSHSVLQSTLPQKEEYVLLIRLTPLQRKLYDRFMNEVVRSTSVPNPLKAFAICCKIWNHPDVLYNFLKKRSEINAAIEEDLDLEEIGGITKRGRARRSTAPPRRAAQPRGSSKKPAATIPPNTTTGPIPPRPDVGAYGNPPYPPNAPYGPPNAYRPDQPPGQYPPYPNYQNQGPGYYPPNQGYNQNYDNNYYQQQPPYGNNYPNQYPQNMPEGEQGYNQNYWGNGNYYGNTGYYNNPSYQNSQTQQDFRGNPSEYNNSQHYPPNYNQSSSNNQPYPAGALQPYANNPENYNTQQRAPYEGYNNQQGYSDYNTNTPSTGYQNNPAPSYPNQSYPPTYDTNTHPSYGNNTNSYNQFGNQPANFAGFPNNMPPSQTPASNMSNQPAVKTESITPENNYPTPDIKSEPNIPPQSQTNTSTPQYGNTPYGFPSNNTFAEQTENNSNGNYPCNYQSFPHSLVKTPLDSAGSGSPVTSWPLTEIKTEVDKLKAEEKTEIKSESDGEVKIEDLDTKKIVKEETKKTIHSEPLTLKDQILESNKAKVEGGKSNGSDSEADIQKKGKKSRSKKGDKVKPKAKAKAKKRNDRKTSKDKNNEESESEESEKEEKLSREEELAIAKKAEEVTYDWAADLLKDYIPGIIENSAKMELFFYILNESIKMGDRILLFSQSLFTLNLIEDFLEKNFIPGTNCLWERNKNYYRLDGSTHALEREKLINEFNTNPHIYLFLVSTRAGSLGINLVGANRVIVFDASWNPCHDTQAVCRVYRYGQRKPCFVYRFVMDCCLEKKIYDRQINKQGMADRVVDECNPDAVLSMKEITNLCLDNDEKESEIKDLTEHKDKYIDVLMQGIITYLGKLLNKEPFQHESLLVDRKEKKLSSAEKRLAQRGYELEKKAALAPKPTTAYRTVRTADGSLVQRPVASVRPMQHGARWIPADVWRRQGMTAQEMTLPLDVVIPTNSAEKTNIVLKAGQRVMVLKSPKGIYMQLESGKIIAIKTSFKGLGQKGDNKDNGPLGKKVLSGRPSIASIPGSLKNNSAITITSKTGPRPGFHRVIRPSIIGQGKSGRPMIPGQKIVDIRNRLGEIRSYTTMRPKSPMQGRMLRPSLPGSVSITKISRGPKTPEIKDSSEKNKTDGTSDEDTQVLDSEDEDNKQQRAKSLLKNEKDSDKLKAEEFQSVTNETNTLEQKQHETVNEAVTSQPETTNSQAESATSQPEPATSHTEPTMTQPEPNISQLEPTISQLEPTISQLQPTISQLQPTISQLQPTISQPEPTPMVLTTDEKLLPEDILDNKGPEENINMQSMPHELPTAEIADASGSYEALKKNTELERKINTLKNYRHQRPGVRPSLESSLSQLERTASVLNQEGLPDFRRNLDDITQSYSPTGEERPTAKPKKKRSPNKLDSTIESQPPAGPSMSHSVSSMLGPSVASARPRRTDLNIPNTLPVAPIEMNTHSRLMSRGVEHEPPPISHMGHGQLPPSHMTKPLPVPINMAHPGMMSGGTALPAVEHPKPLAPNPLSVPPVPMYPGGNPSPEGHYPGQYPGYGMGYGAYPNPAYYAGYGGNPYYPPYGGAGPPGAPVPPSAAAPTPSPSYTPEGYLPPNAQW